jgi:hypothetical protein
MADIAKIGFSADTNELKSAKADIQALVPAGQAAEKQADKLGNALEKTARSGRSASTGAEQAATGVRNLATALDVAATAGRRQEASMLQAATGVRNLGMALEAATRAHYANAAGANAAASGVRGLGAAIMASQRATRLMARDGLNLGRQFSDIGVTMAMGMNPLMIAIQQGPQLMDIFQERALVMGTSVTAAMRSMAAAIWAALVPLLPFIAALALVVGTVTGAFALFSRSVSTGLDDVSKGMGLTEKQLERVKDAGVDTAVTMGDVFKAAFQIISEDAAAVLKPLTDRIGEWWSGMLDHITSVAGGQLRIILGFFIGSYRSAVAIWNNFKTVFPALIAFGANLASAAINTFVTNSINGINKLVMAFNIWAEMAGNPLRLNPVAAPDALRTDRDTRMTGELTDVNAAMQSGLASADAYFDSLYGRIRERAIRNRRGLIEEAAGDPEASARSRGQTDAEKFADIVKGAQAEIDAMTAAGQQIGLYGEALARARYETDLFAQAKAKDITLTGEQEIKLRDLAVALARVATENERLAFMENARVAGRERVMMLEAEYAALGLSADATLRLRNETELLAQARAKNINLSPQEIADLRALAGQQTDLEIRIRNTRDALDFAKEGVRGFVDDMRQGLIQGQSFWQSFGNAVINVLNKIIQKLSDRAIDMFFENMSSGGKGGGSGSSGWIQTGIRAIAAAFGAKGSAKGHSFDGLRRYAKGGDFTNSIVTQPTLFRYAKGAKMGEMGEAGPEAIVPLKRGPDGSLGVQVNGSNGSKVINAPVTVNQNFTISGAVSVNDIQAMTRQSAEQAKQEIKRSIVPWLHEYETNGAL